MGKQEIFARIFMKAGLGVQNISASHLCIMQNRKMESQEANVEHSRTLNKLNGLLQTFQNLFHLWVQAGNSALL